MTLAVLAGGLSRRMGRDKAFLPFGRATLLEETVGPLQGLFADVLVAVSPGQAVPALPWRIVEDEVSGQGPLRGILTCLSHARTEACFILACDMPGLSPEIVQTIAAASPGTDITIAVSNGSLKEPLLGVYRKSVVPQIESLLAGGERSILPLFGRVNTCEVRLDSRDIPDNLNTPEDFRTVAAKFRRP